MTTPEEKNNIIKAINNCNIGKLEKYINRNGITLNMWGVMFYVPLINTLQLLIQNNATLEFVKSTINNIKEKRLYITEMIKQGNLKEFKEYIETKDISLKEIQNEDFDILITSIENNASNEIINYIITHFQYKTFNYYNNQNNLVLDKGDTPLFFAINKNNFQLANLLLSNGADINYDSGKILCHLIEYNSLNMKNLKFVLRHGYNIEYLNRFVISLIQRHENENKLLPDSLNVILNYYIFDNSFILNFLIIYKKKMALSTEELENMIAKEQHKIMIKDEWYKEAVSRKHYYEVDAISDLVERDIRDKDLVLKQVKEYYEEICNSYKVEINDNDNELN